MARVTLPPDPWQEVATASGLPADEVISSLQKLIRRGRLEEAVLIAQEMVSTSEALEEKMWSRLSVIAAEDVGLGSPMMPVLVETLYAQAHRLGRGEHDRFMLAVHAVRLLCEAEKDRSTDDLANWAKRAVELGEARPEIPPVARDMHTRAGAAAGKDYRHFLEEASKVVPERDGAEKKWRSWLIAKLDEGKLQ